MDSTNNPPATDVYAFGQFRLLASERLLTRAGEPIKLGSRAFDILHVLVEHAGEVVGQKELIARVWPGVFVEEVSLRVHLAALRKALDGDSGARHVMNVPGRGYSFVVPVARESAGGSSYPAADVQFKPAYVLPPPPARVVGRDETVQEILKRLTAKRFVSIVGPGGMGKTTVALAVAHAALADFRGAVCLVELGALNDPRLLSGVAASALGLTVRVEDSVPSLTAHLRNRRLLLVFDGAEHLIAEVAVLAERLFTDAADLHILVTSREPLRAEGEYVYRLLPLECPPDVAHLTAAAAMTFPATQLFLQRVASSGVVLDLDDANAQVVAEMCRKLGGIALAIELAAARVGAYGLRETAALLDSEFALRWPGRRTAPQRHQTLHAMLDWSFNLLSDDERLVLRRLSVFAGGFSLNAAGAVVSDPNHEGEEVKSLVAGLIGKSLVSVDQGPVMRYRLLDLTRTYAAAKLSEAGETEAFRRRLAIYLRNMLRQYAIENAQPRAHAANIDDIRGALQWAFGPGGDVSVAFDIAAYAAPTFLGMALLTECADWMRKASAVARDSGITPQHLKIQMALAASTLFTASTTDEYEAVWTGALDAARVLADVPSQLSCHLALWAQKARLPAYAVALRRAEECSAAATRSGDPGAIGLAEWMRAVSKYHLGRHIEARVHFQRFVDVDTEEARLGMVEQTGYDRRADGLGAYAGMLRIQGFADQARRMSAAALDAARPLQFALPFAIATAWLGFNEYFMDSDVDKVEADMVELVEHARAHAILQTHGFGLAMLGLCQARRGQFNEALGLVDEGLKLQAQTHYHVLHPIVRSELAEAAVAARRLGDAQSILAQLERDDIHDAEHWCTAETLRVKGTLAEANGDAAAAADLYARALALAHRQGALAWELRAAMNLGRLRESQGRVGEALDDLAPVYARFTEGFATRDVVQAKALLDAWRSRV